jgi:hypothetical protein
MYAQRLLDLAELLQYNQQSRDRTRLFRVAQASLVKTLVAIWVFVNELKSLQSRDRAPPSKNRNGHASNRATPHPYR